jgi:hypothetical protein
MKKLVIAMIITLLVAFSGSQGVMGQNNQPWIYSINEPNHMFSTYELSEIVTNLGAGNIKGREVFFLNSGVSCKINHPKEYLEYLTIAVKSADASVVTTGDVANAIENGNISDWEDDVPYLCKNYFYSEEENRVLFMGNYSGAKKGKFLFINGIPTARVKCGNPLEVYGEDYKPKYKRNAVVADSIKTKNGVTDTVYVIVQLEEKEYLPSYSTTYCRWSGYSWVYYNDWTCPVFYPYYPVSCWGFYRPYWWHQPIYFSNSCYWNPYYHGWYNYSYHNNYYGRNDNSWRRHHGNNNYHSSFDNNNYVNYRKRVSVNNSVRTFNSRNNYTQSNSRNSVNNNRGSSSSNQVNVINSRKGVVTNNLSNIRNSNSNVRNSTNNYNRGTNLNKSTNSNTRSNPVYQNNQNRQRQNYTPSNSNNRGTNNYSPSRSNNSSTGNRSNVNTSRSNSGNTGNRSSSGSNNGRRK